MFDHSLFAKRALALALAAPLAALAQDNPNPVPPGLSALTQSAPPQVVSPPNHPAEAETAPTGTPAAAPVAPPSATGPAVAGVSVRNRAPVLRGATKKVNPGPSVTIKGEAKAENVRLAPSPSERVRASTGSAPPKSLSDTRLPALKGDEAALKPFVLHTRVGVNEVIRLSSSFLNRISTPFTDPVIVDISGSQSKIVGSEVFILPKEGQPVGIYIFDKSNPAQTISLTLVPQADIPGQNILVKIENFRALGNLALTQDARGAETNNTKAADHESVLSNLLINAINGRIPGFSPVPLEAGVAQIEDVKITPDVVFQGYYLDVYRYQLTNEGTRPIALNEGVFYREGIKAVSFFPRDTLAPNESTFVFLVATKGVDKNPGSFLSSRDSEVNGGQGGDPGKGAAQ